MAILKLKNFGVIGENSQDKNGFFSVNFSPVTIFIGKQASGKSTIAKLISIFSWLEKKMTRDNAPSPINIPIPVFELLCYQQEITKEYFHPNTKISYNGDVYIYEYDQKRKKITAKKSSETDTYILPKIQYITSARNLLTILYEIEFPTTLNDNKGNIISNASNIPFMVNDLNITYTKALKELANNGFSLPINNIKLFYKNHNTFIKPNDATKISMSAASSGIQSITPLLIVSKFLSNEVKKNLLQKLQTQINEISKKQLEDEIIKEDVDLYKTYSNLKDGFFYKDNISQSEKNNISKIEKISQKFIPSCFFNIVEEPEQNLFPETQADVLYELLECKNTNNRNKLVITTHSPYILTALNNAILASDVYNKTGKTLNAIPLNKMVSFDDVSAYKLEDGKIISITDNESRLIDASQIDVCSSEINGVFDDLLDIYDGQENN